jgi:hypothetical protein
MKNSEKAMEARFAEAEACIKYSDATETKMLK